MPVTFQDESLVKDVGLSKIEVRKLRNFIESQGAGPTMMKAKMGAAAKAKANPTEASKEAAAAGSRYSPRSPTSSPPSGPQGTVI